MYDIVTKTINLTDDEIAIMKEVLETRQDKCVSIGETLTIEGLLEKLDQKFEVRICYRVRTYFYGGLLIFQ